MNLSTKNKLYFFYLTGFFLISALHLLSVPPLFHPAAFGKSIIFKIIFSLMLFVFLYENLFLNKEKIKKVIKEKSKILLPLIGLVSTWLIYVLSTIFSLSPKFSFWGSPVRGGGSLNILLLIIFSFLIFIILKERDWQKLWDFNIIVAVFVSLVAAFQKFELFSNFLNPASHRPFSTMGGTAFLAAYLLLLFFPTISFGLKKIRVKSLFYFASAFLFLIVIFISATRAVLLALAIGTIFFLFSYPKKIKFKNLPIFKIAVVLILFVAFTGAFWLKSQPQVVEKLGKNSIFGDSFRRTWDSVNPALELNEITFEKIVSRGRYSGWKVLWPALKERPILGYGPENISIPFDKHLDPSIPGITRDFEGGWWDRAHNIFLEKAITVGFLGLVAYLFIFITLFWRLQERKREKPLEVMGLQTAFVAYFVANFFSFDVFSTYLALFFLVGYSLFLIRGEITIENQEKCTVLKNSLWKYVLITISIFVLTWFIWLANIKPLLINKEVNNALFASNRGNCQKAFEIMNPLLLQSSFIDNYIRLEYINIINTCDILESEPSQKLELYRKAVFILDEAKSLRPHYTRTWLYSAVYMNKILELSDQEIITKEEGQRLLKESLHDIEKASELSPKRVDVTLTLIKYYILNQNYEKALEKSEECLEISPDSGECLWSKALVLISIGEEKSEETLETIKKAIEKGYGEEADIVIPQLIKMYISLAQNTGDIKYYRVLRDLYIEQIKLNPGRFQSHASLAYVYKELEEYDKAREHANIVLELSPESGANVKAFLDSLPN